jgi:hypothetical protein
VPERIGEHWQISDGPRTRMDWPWRVIGNGHALREQARGQPIEVPPSRFRVQSDHSSRAPGAAADIRATLLAAEQVRLVGSDRHP